MANTDKDAKLKRTKTKMAESDDLEAQVSAAQSYASTFGATDPTFTSVLLAVKKKEKHTSQSNANNASQRRRSPVIEQAIRMVIAKIGTTNARLVKEHLERYTRNTPLDVELTPSDLAKLDLEDGDYIVFVEDKQLCRALADGSPTKDRGQDIAISTVSNVIRDLKKPK